MCSLVAPDCFLMKKFDVFVRARDTEAKDSFNQFLSLFLARTSSGRFPSLISGSKGQE